MISLCTFRALFIAYHPEAPSFPGKEAYVMEYFYLRIGLKLCFQYFIHLELNKTHSGPNMTFGLTYDTFGAEWLNLKAWMYSHNDCIETIC